LNQEGRLLYPGAWDRCTLFDVNYRPKQMSVEQLEDGVTELWREIWSGASVAGRKRHYRELLRARKTRTRPLAETSRLRALAG
jgi:hypothetical protein